MFQLHRKKRIIPLNISNVTLSGVHLDVKGQPLPINELNETHPLEAFPISNLHRRKQNLPIPKIKIVVSRYNEDIEWTKQFDNVIIYNKGAKLDSTIPLPNVGREGHTYYTYICHHYDELDDFTLFLQGNPFDHSPNIISTINHYLTDRPPQIAFEFVSETILLTYFSGCRIHRGLPIREIYKYLFDENKESGEIDFGAGAQFIVSKERIRARPKHFYQKIVDILNKSVNPIEGFVIERLHKMIFSK